MDAGNSGRAAAGELSTVHGTEWEAFGRASEDDGPALRAGSRRRPMATDFVSINVDSRSVIG